MKIVIVNYRYFVSGGPERYMFNIINVLTNNGHVIIPFSIKHNQNVPTQFEPLFLDPIGSGDEIYSHEYRKNLKTIWQVVGRMIYSMNAKKKFKAFLKLTKPDIIYILQFQNKISCSIIDAATEMKIPVVQRISDFGHICPSAILYRKGKGICEDCLDKGLFQAVKHKCISDSYFASSIKTLSLVVMNKIRIKDKINAFVFPSAFTLHKYKLARFTTDKLYHIPTFFYSNLPKDKLKISYENFALFIGRISEEKGIQTLIDSFINTDFNLKIIGFSNDGEYEQFLKKQLNGKKHQIEFLGGMDFNEISVYLKKCLFTIVPSQWYDNSPNTILESFAFKKAVLATNIGSLKELILNGKTGFLFEAGNSLDLRTKVKFLFSNPDICIRMGKSALYYLKKNYSEDNHYQKLTSVFNCLVRDERPTSNRCFHY